MPRHYEPLFLVLEEWGRICFIAYRENQFRVVALSPKHNLPYFNVILYGLCSITYLKFVVAAERG